MKARPEQQQGGFCRFGNRSPTGEAGEVCLVFFPEISCYSVRGESPETKVSLLKVYKCFNVYQNKLGARARFFHHQNPQKMLAQAQTTATPAVRPLKALVADKMTSTFWWEMFLDPAQPLNCVEKMTGYSKFQGHDEAKDKRQLLMRKVIMLYTTGWLNKSTQICMYCRVGEFIDKKRDEMMFVLKRDHVELSPRYLQDFELVRFFEKFYQMLRSGKDVKTLLPAPKAHFSKDEYLNIDLQHPRIGTDEMKLNNYCARLIRNGHAFGAVNHFFTQYKEKYLRNV